MYQLQLLTVGVRYLCFALHILSQFSDHHKHHCQLWQTTSLLYIISVKESLIRASYNIFTLVSQALSKKLWLKANLTNKICRIARNFHMHKFSKKCFGQIHKSLFRTQVVCSVCIQQCISSTVTGNLAGNILTYNVRS